MTCRHREVDHLTPPRPGWSAFDYDPRKLLEIDPDPGTGVRTATNTIYDANGRAVEVDKGSP